MNSQKHNTEFKTTGFGKGKTKNTAKGRILNTQSLQEVEVLIGDKERTPAMTIEFLHLIQDTYGCITAEHMHALATILGTSQAEVNETASFYAHFDIVKKGEQKPAPLTIRVCESIGCHIMGAKQLKKSIEEGVNPADVRVINAPCMGRCHVAPVIEVGHNHIGKATAVKAVKAVEEKDTHHTVPDYQSFEAYCEEGGFTFLRSLLDGKHKVEDIIEKVKGSGLRGLGGAGFPVGLKWSFVRAEKGQRLMAVNGDEGEPGTLKDHHYLSRRPFQFLEGMLIGAWVVEATDVYIYLRDCLLYTSPSPRDS